MQIREVGKIKSSGTGCFQWIIVRLLSETLHDNRKLLSPNFSFLGAVFYIGLYMNKTNNTLEVHLKRLHDSPKRRLYVKLGVPTRHEGKIETRTGEINRNDYFFGTFPMQWSEVLDGRCEILADGQLTVFCELRRFDVRQNASVLHRSFPVVKKLQRDLKDLFVSGDDCDVTIRVQDKEFPAHSLILRARSPVFKSMFSHEMAEKLSGVVVIEDCDPVTFLDFLYYLYTASIKHISDENVCQLYTVSDKYQVEELKQACAAFMKNHICVGTFCDILTLALRHAEKELINLSTEFFCVNAIEITKSEKWPTFLIQNMTVGNELCIKALSGRKNV